MTLPDDLDRRLAAFVEAQPGRPSFTSVVEAALGQYLDGPRERGSRIVDVVRERDRIREAAERAGARRIGLFGSTARAQDGPDSDVDLWIDARPGTTLFDLAELRSRLSELLGCRVDLVTLGSVPADERDALVASSLVL